MNKHISIALATTNIGSDEFALQLLCCTILPANLSEIDEQFWLTALFRGLYRVGFRTFRNCVTLPATIYVSIPCCIFQLHRKIHVTILILIHAGVIALVCLEYLSVMAITICFSPWVSDCAPNIFIWTSSKGSDVGISWKWSLWISNCLFLAQLWQSITVLLCLADNSPYKRFPSSVAVHGDLQNAGSVTGNICDVALTLTTFFVTIRRFLYIWWLLRLC